MKTNYVALIVGAIFALAIFGILLFSNKTKDTSCYDKGGKRLVDSQKQRVCFRQTEILYKYTLK